MVEQVNLDADWFEMLRLRLRSGQEKPSGARCVYKGARPLEHIRIRTSSKSITLVESVWAPNAGKSGQMRYVTAGKFDVRREKPISAAEVRKMSKTLNQQGVKEAEKTQRDYKIESERDEWSKKTNRKLLEVYYQLPDTANLATFKKTRIRKDIGREESELQYTIRKYFLEWPLTNKTIGRKNFGDAKPSEFTAQEIMDWLNALRRKRGYHTARITQAYVRAAFRALQRNTPLTPENSLPEGLSLTSKEIRRKEYTRRSGKFDAITLKRFWEALKADYISDLERDLVKFMLFSCQRETQITLTKWGAINPHAKRIEYSASEMKGPYPFFLPLTDTLMEIVERQLRIKDSDFVFSTSQGNSFTNWSKLASKIDAAMAGVDFKGQSHRKAAPFPWRFHDIRRTATQLLEDATPKIQKPIQRRMLAHSPRVDTAFESYQPDENFEDLREGFETLTREILMIVEPEKVAAENAQTKRINLLAEKERIEAELQKLAS